MQRNLIVKEVDIHICFLKHFINAFVWAKARWCRTGLIFREVEVNSIGGVSMLVIQLLIRHDSKSSNCYTTAPLVINQAQLDWPRREGFSCKRIEEHKQKDVNTQSDIANMNEANQRGVQELDSKEPIDTVEEIKNGGLDHCKRTCCHSYNESISVSRRKTQELNKTLI